MAVGLRSFRKMREQLKRDIGSALSADPKTIAATAQSYFPGLKIEGDRDAMVRFTVEQIIDRTLTLDALNKATKSEPEPPPVKHRGK